MALMNDVLPLIIEHVDDKATLYSLLTVSKQVCHNVCRVLYRDPFRFFRHAQSKGNLSQSRLLSLVRLLLSLSPATGDEVNLVRTEFGVPKKHQAGAEAVLVTTLDYLSFVECVRWEHVLYQYLAPLDKTMFDGWSPSPGVVQSVQSFIRCTLTWCFCGHQLDQMRELEIEHQDIERYISKVSQLRRLRTLVVPIFHDYDIENANKDTPENLPTPYPSAVRFVQAHQQYHGKELLQECRFTRQMQTNCLPETDQWEADIRSLLPLVLPKNLKLVLPLRPMDSYLSRVTSLIIADRNRQKWDMISKHYSDMSVGQILQRFRSLVYLHISFLVPGMNSPENFTWAADEARERATGRLLAPAVPLEGLSLELPVCTDNHPPRLLMDGLRGFASSLQNLMLTVRATAADARSSKTPAFEGELFRDETIVLRRLQSIAFTSQKARQFDYRILQLCPNLTHLNVTEHDRTAVSTSQNWPIVELPSLVSLVLVGLPVISFDPASLHGMPKLQNLRIFLLRSPPHRVASLGRWTWDWVLPELTTLDVQWCQSMTMFSFAVLRNCPKLEFLGFDLWSEQKEEPVLLRVLSLLKDPIQDTFPGLLELSLKRGFHLQPEDLEVLLGRALPGLRRLTLGELSPSDVQQVVKLTRQHSSLVMVFLEHTPLDYVADETLNIEKSSFGVSYPGYCSITLCPKNNLPAFFQLQRNQ